MIEQLSLLRQSHIRNVDCTFVGGTDIDFVMNQAKANSININVVATDPSPEMGEGYAMSHIQRICADSDEPVLYLHTKGASHSPNDLRIIKWRRLMEEFVVRKWYMNVMFLSESADTVGVNYRWDSARGGCYCGNFWLSTAAHIRRLPDYWGYHTDRYSAQHWLGTVPHRVKTLLCFNKRFNHPDYDFDTLKRFDVTVSVGDHFTDQV